MAEVVGAELALEPVDGQLPRRCHHPRVVYEDIDSLIVQPLGELTYARERREIELLDSRLGSDRGGGLLALLDVPAGHHHLRSSAGQLARDRQSQAAVGSGHDRGLAGLIRHLGGRPPPRHHAVLRATEAE
jgi:hypothetical protein